jgi:hypothetical protein
MQEHRNTGLHGLASSQPLTRTFVVPLCGEREKKYRFGREALVVQWLVLPSTWRRPLFDGFEGGALVGEPACCWVSGTRVRWSLDTLGISCHYYLT